MLINFLNVLNLTGRIFLKNKYIRYMRYKVYIHFYIEDISFLII